MMASSTSQIFAGSFMGFGGVHLLILTIVDPTMFTPSVNGIAAVLAFTLFSFGLTTLITGIIRKVKE